MKPSLFAVLLLILISTPSRLVFGQSMSARQGQGAVASAGAPRSGMRQGGTGGGLSRRPLQHSRGLHNQPFLFPGSSLGEGDVSVSIEQSQPSPTVQQEKPTKAKYYVPPRWVGTEQGVEVLMPSFWTDDPQVAGVKGPAKIQPVLREY